MQMYIQYLVENVMFFIKNIFTKEARAALNYIAKENNFSKEQVVNFILTEALHAQIRNETMTKQFIGAHKLSNEELRKAYAKSVFSVIRNQSNWRANLMDEVGLSNSLSICFMERMKKDKIIHVPKVITFQKTNQSKKIILVPSEGKKVLIPEHKSLKAWYLVMSDYRKKYP